MKFDNNSSDIQMSGDIKQNKVSIDQANTDFIVTILSSNLYSSPLESFLRETVSNAWDSHVEAGVETPVILFLGLDVVSNKYYCSIQDYGVGISPERFDQIYRNIGSSTKRETNEQIGGFGIGRFSALAYSNTVYINTIYDGIKYEYLMYKDGNSISIDLLGTSETGQHNGTEVKVFLNEPEHYSGSYKELNNFMQAIETQLCYFENLWLATNIERIENEVETFNELKIKKFEHFNVNDVHYNSYNKYFSYSRKPRVNLLLGKVIYPLNFEILGYDKYDYELLKLPITLKFDIGTLPVTPNREEIIYNTKSISIIKDKFENALLELEKLYKKEDFNNLNDYVESIIKGQKVTIPLGLTLITFDLPKCIKREITLKGVKYNTEDFITIYNCLFKHQYEEFKIGHYITSERGNFKGTKTSLEEIKKNFKDYFICDFSKLPTLSKKYVREYYESSYTLPMKHFNALSFYRKFLTQIERSGIKRTKEVLTITKLLFTQTLKNLNKLDKFRGDEDVPVDFIEDLKKQQKSERENRKTSVRLKDSVTIHKFRESKTRTNKNRGITTESTTYVLEELLNKYKKQRAIYGDSTNREVLSWLYTFTNSFRTVENNKPNFVIVAKNNFKYFEDKHNWTYIKDFMNTNDKLFRRMGTSIFLKRHIPNLQELKRIDNLDRIFPEFTKDIYTLGTFVEKYLPTLYYQDDYEKKQSEALQNEIYELCEKENRFDEEVRSLYFKHKKIFDISPLFLMFRNNYGVRLDEEKINLLVDYIKTKKLATPSLEAINRLKEETIFNIKKEENESTEN